MLSKQRINAVGHTFYLFNVTAFHMAKLENLAVGWREKSMRVWIQWTSTWFESSIEEGREVRIYMKVGLGHLVKATGERKKKVSKKGFCITSLLCIDLR